MEFAEKFNSNDFCSYLMYLYIKELVLIASSTEIS